MRTGNPVGRLLGIVAVLIIVASMLLVVPERGEAEVSGTWSAMTSGTTNQLLGVWGSSATDVFAVGDTGAILHYDGSAWGTMTSGSTSQLFDIWGNSGTDVFAVGDVGTILHYDGSAWSTMTSGTTEVLRAVWGNSGTDVFAVGDVGTILHYDGSAWSTMTSVSTSLLCGVRGNSATDVFAVGVGGTILHYDGSAWSSMTSGTTNQLLSVWGSSATDVFAVGMGGTILYYNGAAWSSMTGGTTNQLFSVWGSSATDVFAVGMGGTILHYDASAWSTMSSGTTQALWRVWGSSATDAFAVGVAGTVLHYGEPPVLIITTVSLSDGHVGVAYSQDLAASGGSGSYTWSVSSGSLPSWATLDASTGAITGTPDATATTSFAVQVGDGIGTATKYLSITIDVAPTATTVASATNPSLYGQSVTFTATVTGTGATGTVTFQDGGTTLGSSALVNGTAIYSTSSLFEGSHTIYAVYNGDANFAGSTSSALTQTVTQSSGTSSTATVASSANPSVYGQSVTFTATVTGTGATGTVTFQDGGTTLGSSALVNGTATYSTSSLFEGSHAIYAVYNGDANFAGSASSALTQTVTQSSGTSTTATVASSANPSVYGQSVTFTATVSGAGATGTVIFQEGSTTLGSSTLVNGTATYSISTLSAGSHTITAVYNGDANFAGSTSSAFTETVTQAGGAYTTTTLSSSDDHQAHGKSVTLTATVSGTGATGTVTFKDGDAILGSSALGNGTATLSTSDLSVGDHSITAVYSGDATFAGSTSPSLGQTITAASSAASSKTNWDLIGGITAAVVVVVGVAAALSILWKRRPSRGRLEVEPRVQTSVSFSKKRSFIIPVSIILVCVLVCGGLGTAFWQGWIPVSRTAGHLSISFQTESALPLSTLSIATKGLSRDASVTVTFSDSSGYSVTQNALSVDKNGTVLVGVPLYVDPQMHSIKEGKVSVLVSQTHTDGSQGPHNSPVSFTIEDLPSLTGIPLGKVTRSLLTASALFSQRNIMSLQFLEDASNGEIEASEMVESDRSILNQTIAFRNDVDSIMADAEHSVDVGSLADGTPIQFTRDSLDVSDRVIAVWLLELLSGKGPTPSAPPSTGSSTSSLQLRQLSCLVSSGTTAAQGVADGVWLGALNDLCDDLCSLNSLFDDSNVVCNPSSDRSDRITAVVDGMNSGMSLVGKSSVQMGLFAAYTNTVNAYRNVAESDMKCAVDAVSYLVDPLNNRRPDIDALPKSSAQKLIFANVENTLSIKGTVNPAASFGLWNFASMVLNKLTSSDDKDSAIIQAIDDSIDSIDTEGCVITGTLQGGGFMGRLDMLWVETTPSTSAQTPIGALTDVNGTYSLVIPLSPKDDPATTLSIRASDPITDVSFGSEVVNLRGVDTSRPVEIPPLVTEVGVTGTWYGTLQWPGAPYDGCEAETVSYSVTLDEDSNGDITGSTSAGSTVTGSRTGSCISVTLDNPQFGSSSYAWTWDGADTMTGSVDYYCYSLDTGAIQYETLMPFTLTRQS